MEREETGGGVSVKPPATKIPRQPRSKVLTTPKRASRQKVTRSNNNGGGSLGRRINRSGGSTGSRQGSTPRPPASQNEVQIKPPAPPKPAAPSSSAYLKSDTVYQRQLASYAKALADFQADQGLARTDYDTGYQSTNRDIGLAKQEASTNLQDDYASRGLLKSSLYNTALGDLNQQYQNQFNDLGKQRTSFFDQLGQEFSKYKNEQSTQSQNALQEALRRRTEKYNL